MTSKNLFLFNMKENLKRRGAVLVTFLIYFFFAFPVVCALKINNYLYYKTSVTPEQNPNVAALRRDLCSLLGVNGAATFFVTVLAILCAVQGFSYLHKRHKVDLYHALPVSSNRRFATIYLNGILSFALTYLAALVLSILICTTMWAFPDAGLLKAMFYAYGMYLLLYLCIYNLAIVAVTLTGNTVISCFAVVTLMFYQTIVFFLFYGFQATFFKTYLGSDSRDIIAGLFSPFNSFIAFTATSDMKYLYQLFSYGLLSLAAAWFLYRKRPAESCGKSIACPKLRPVLKFLLLIPFALTSTVFFYFITGESLPFALFGMIIGLLLGHSILEILFEFDLRAALQHWKSLLLCSAAAVLIFCSFAFDIFGYDRFIPSEKQLVSAGWVPYSANSFLWDQSSPSETKPLENMEITDKETILALTELAVHHEPVSYGFSFDILYRLKGGRKVYRSLTVEYEDAKELLNRLYLSEEYKNATLVLNDRDAMQLISASATGLTYSDNTNTEPAEIKDWSGFSEAYREDYKSLTLTDTIEEGFILGELNLYYQVTPSVIQDSLPHAHRVYENNKHSGSRCITLPLYASFTHTIAWLEEHNVNSVTAADEIPMDELTLSGRYVTGDGAPAASLFITITDPGQIQELLPLLQPAKECRLNGTFLQARSSANNESISAYFYIPETDQLPASVLQAIKEQENTSD